MFGKTILKMILLASNIVAAILYILALAGSVVSPDKFIVVSYFALVFPIIILFNIAFVVMWIAARKWYFMISLALIMLSFSQINNIFTVHSQKRNIELSTVQPLKILTYNTMMSGKLVKHTKTKPNMVFKYIQDVDADIVCLQEFTVSDKNEYLTRADINKIFAKYPYKHIHFKSTNATRHHGIATFSKFPIVNKKTIDFPSFFNVSIYSDIEVYGKTIRIINNHLESNNITENDKVLPLILKERFDAENLTGITKHFSRKLGNASKRRAVQADAVSEIITESPFNTIACGDFNDVPLSYSYTKIRGKMNDAFTDMGNGFGWTFNDRLYHFRIDYLLYDKNAFTVTKYKSDNVKYSDHQPVYCELNVN